MLQPTVPPSTDEATASPQAPPPVRARNVTVSYDGRPVLRSVSFELPTASLTGVIGPNGAGKSTLLKALLGLIPLDAGHIEIFGSPVEQNRNRVAYVPQKQTVDWDFPVTALDVVLMGRYGHLGLLGRPSRKDRVLAREALEQVAMTPFGKRHIRQLSGGQQQRIFLARALCQGADVMLLDEPLGGVDAATEETLFELMEHLNGLGKTLLMVNHDLSVLDRFSMVLLLNQRVVGFGPTAETATEANLHRTYGGRLSLLDRAETALHEMR